MKDKKAKIVLDGFIEIGEESKSKPNYELLKEEDFTMTLFKYDYITITF